MSEFHLWHDIQIVIEFRYFSDTSGFQIINCRQKVDLKRISRNSLKDDTVVVVGGAFTGYEAATNLIARLGKLADDPKEGRAILM